MRVYLNGVKKADLSLTVERGSFLPSTVKKFLSISNADRHEPQPPEECLNWKNQSPRPQKHTLDIKKPYNLLIFKKISKFYK